MPGQQVIEHKSVWNDDYLRWICGFANAQGGRLYIGKDDSGNVIGVKNAKKLLEDLPIPYNPDIANAFFRSGYVEAWGRGIEKINEHCTDAGLPLPLLSYNHSGYWVEFRKDIYNHDSLKEMGLNERQVDALIHFKSKGEIVSSEYAQKYHISDRTARRDLSDLAEKKFLKNEGYTKFSRYVFL